MPTTPTSIHRVKIILVDANKEILKELDPALRRVARKKLADLQIEVINNVKAKVTADRVILGDGREIMVENVIWTAGSRASVKLDEIDSLTTSAGALRWIALCGSWPTTLWGIGDCAATWTKTARPCPQRPGRRAGGRGRSQQTSPLIDGGAKPFRYSSLGQLVELGS